MTLVSHPFPVHRDGGKRAVKIFHANAGGIVDVYKISRPDGYLTPLHLARTPKAGPFFDFLKMSAVTMSGFLPCPEGRPFHFSWI